MFAAQALLAEMTAVWRLVVHLCAAEETEAIVQAVYMRVFDAAGRVPPDCRGSARLWLLRVTCDVVRERQSAADDREPPPQFPFTRPNDAIDHALQTGICALPMRERMVFLLSVSEGLRYDDIATVVRSSPADVGTTLKAAHQHLRRSTPRDEP